MLRQALDAANGQAQIHNETDPLIPTPSQSRSHDQEPTQDSERIQNQGYGAAAGTSEAIEPEGSEVRSFDDAEGYFIQEWEDEADPTPEQSLFERAWGAVKGCFVIVVNVENLWDSPELNEARVSRSRRNHLVVLLWFFILATSYASERYTFKLVVDRTGPFRLFAVEMVTICHATMVGFGMLISALSKRDCSIQPLGIPVVDVGLMALLDTVHMLLVFLTGFHVPPTLTVILVQFTLPLTALITQFVHPDGCTRRCCGQSTGGSRNSDRQRPREQSPSSLSNTASISTDSDHYDPVEAGIVGSLTGWGGLSVEHLLGSVIILLAVLLALCPAIYSICDPNFFIYADTIPLQTAYNTLLFVSSCVPAAASQLYKEHIFLQYKQPVQQDFLNFILSIFQLIFASIMAPLVYTLQGLGAGDDWPTLYPSTDFSQNFVDGLQCFLGVLPDDLAVGYYADDAQCNFSLVLVIFHSLSIIMIGVAVDKIVNAGATKVMYRGVSAGIIFSVVGLYLYDLNIPDFSYGAAIDSLNLICLLLLIIGSEVYHRVSLQDATFETVYQEVESFYDLE